MTNISKRTIVIGFGVLILIVLVVTLGITIHKRLSTAFKGVLKKLVIKTGDVGERFGIQIINDDDKSKVALSYIQGGEYYKGDDDIIINNLPVLDGFSLQSLSSTGVQTMYYSDKLKSNTCYEMGSDGVIKVVSCKNTVKDIKLFKMKQKNSNKCLTGGIAYEGDPTSHYAMLQYHECNDKPDTKLNQLWFIENESLRPANNRNMKAALRFPDTNSKATNLWDPNTGTQVFLLDETQQMYGTLNKTTGSSDKWEIDSNKIRSSFMKTRWISYSDIGEASIGDDKSNIEFEFTS